MIFYFSGTGNTEWAAKRLSEKTRERLLFIPEEMNGNCVYELEEGERIGFCFPVHGWQPPGIVRRFIKRLHIENSTGHYCYAVVTCGDSIGRSMEMLNKELNAIGLHTDSVFSLVMPESYVCLPFMKTDKPEKEKRKITTAKALLEGYADSIVQRSKGLTMTKRGLTPWLFTHVIGRYFNNHMISDKKFMVDNDRCIHCGMCARVCPTGDVTLREGMPTWGQEGQCTCCLACYHHCPQHAINYGNITRKRGQYYFGKNHPEITN